MVGHIPMTIAVTEKGKRMTDIAIWIIAICEVFRAVQNIIQLMMLWHDRAAMDNAYSEFVKSLKYTDKEFVERLLEEFDQEDERENF